MATPADQRLLELLEKWLTSLELHAKYASLDDESYSKVQPWPEHQRPSRWIVDLARQKAITLRNSLEERIKMGDAKFSDSLELMTFLANLVGSEHIERFIPLADPTTERALGPDTQNAPTVEAPGPAASGTREMPKFVVGTPRAPPPPGTAQVARTERKAATAKSAPPVQPAGAPPVLQAPPSSAESADGQGPSEDVREQVLARYAAVHEHAGAAVITASKPA